MGNDCCSEGPAVLTAKRRPTEVNIQKVSNGYIVGGYGMDRRVALTLSEALEIIRKEME